MTEAPKPLKQEPTRDMVEAAYPLLTSRPVDTPDRARRLAHELWQVMWEAAPRPSTTGLTRHQQSVHNFLAEYIGQHDKSPLWSEIIEGTTVPAADHLRQILNSLDDRGVISRSNKHSRNITLHIWPGEQLPNRTRK